jgi:hypothetical protein
MRLLQSQTTGWRPCPAGKRRFLGKEATGKHRTEATEATEVTEGDSSRGLSAQRKTPTRRFAEPSPDPWSLETSPPSLLILESAILTGPVGEFELSFSLRPDSQGSSEE